MRDEIGKNLILGVGVAFEKDDDLIDKQISDFGDDVYKKCEEQLIWKLAKWHLVVLLEALAKYYQAMQLLMEIL